MKDPSPILVRVGKEESRLEAKLVDEKDATWKLLFCSDALRRKLFTFLAFDPGQIIKVTPVHENGFWTERLEKVDERT